MEFPVLDKVTDTYLIFSPGIKQGRQLPSIWSEAQFAQTCFTQCFSRVLVGVPHNKPCWRQTPMCKYLIGGVISGKRKINRKGEKLSPPGWVHELLTRLENLGSIL